MDYAASIRATDREAAKKAISEALETHPVNMNGQIDWTPVTTAAGIMIDTLEDKPLDVVVSVTGQTNYMNDFAHHAFMAVDAMLVDRIG